MEHKRWEPWPIFFSHKLKRGDSKDLITLYEFHFFFLSFFWWFEKEYKSGPRFYQNLLLFKWIFSGRNQQSQKKGLEKREERVV